jgi:hypothetical protein
MVSAIHLPRNARKTTIPLGIALVTASALASPAYAQQTVFTGVPAGGVRIVCQSGNTSIYIVNSSDDCSFDDPANAYSVSGFRSGNATFSETTNRTDIAGGTLLVNGVTTTFAGGTTGFSSPVTFSGSSVTVNSNTTFGNASTFNALADFNNGITSNTITNSGTINTATLSAGTIVGTSITASGSLLVSSSSTVDMGNNRIQGVAAGTADTDAVNVAQLNAATSDIVTDVTALETVTATHTTQIATLETTTATHTTQIAAQATQISALQAADMAFDSRIDTLELLAAELDDRIGKVDDRASAGTAAAVALSGAMFLPGKSFNLTGNVGTYRGAHAAAVQFGALVSDRVALNAGIAHGFNKGGKTALRAGFTIGW